MGTTGEGRFDDYALGGPEGCDESDLCERIIENLVLEEVATSEYYHTQGVVPTVGTALRLRAELHEGRLVLETNGGQIVGLVPTAYNYLLRCMAQGYAYSGEVTAATEDPIPAVNTRLEPLT